MIRYLKMKYLWLQTCRFCMPFITFRPASLGSALSWWYIFTCSLALPLCHAFESTRFCNFKSGCWHPSIVHMWVASGEHAGWESLRRFTTWYTWLFWDAFFVGVFSRMWINGLDIHSGVGVVGLSEEAAGLLVGDAVGSFVLFIILFTCVTSNSRIVALHH